MKKAVIYARYSSSNQTEQSIEGQLRDCCRYAEQEGLTVVGEYIDRAISGRTANRPQFQQMIEDAEKKMFDIIIVWKLDRFSRDKYDSAVYKKKLKDHGVIVKSYSEPIDDSAEGGLMESMMEAFNQYFSEELGRKVRRGIRESVLKGKTIGLLPFGYKSVNAEIKIDEPNAEIAKEIFERYCADGGTLRGVARWLNKQGIKTAKGSEWTASTISRLLRNKHYIGIHALSNGEAVGECPRIISDELFKRAERKMKVNTRKSRKHAYPLVGKIFCDCSGRMYGDTVINPKGVTYFYYRCKTCRRVVRQDVLEPLAIGGIRRELTEEKIHEIAVKASKYYENKAKENGQKHSLTLAIDKQRKEVKKIANVLVAYGEPSQALLEALHDAEGKLKALEEQEKKQNSFTQMSAVSQNDIETFLSWGIQGNQVLKLLLNKVIVCKEHADIYINLRDDVDEDMMKSVRMSLCSENVAEGVPLATNSKIIYISPSIFVLRIKK